jgi:nucleoside-diphosphate-sugar epimerase
MRIFVTGASGYIGGAVAARLQAAGHEVSGLTRSAETAKRLAARGIRPVVGDLGDAPALAAAARAADAVLNTADADHPGAAEALVKALEGSGKTLIHTSGTSITADTAMGERGERIRDEATPFEPVPEKAARVAIDRVVLGAAGRGVRAAVLCPSLIYGRSTGLHPESIQLPLLVAAAKRRGAGVHIGKGANIWSNVHIEDVAEAYLLALDRARAGGFYFLENGEASFKAVAEAISRRLGFGGKTESWPPEDAIKALGYSRAAFSLASNVRVRGKATRAELGWQPKHESVIAAIERGDF